jgi:cell division transport system permease protein
LSAAAALTLFDAARQGRSELTRQATVQLLEDDPQMRAVEQQKLASRLRKMPGIASVRAVPESEARALLQPWLGDSAEAAGIPVPALIDVEFAQAPSAERLLQMRRELARDKNGNRSDIRVDGNAQWLEPWFRLMRTLLAMAGGIVLLLLLATAATVALAVRGALNTHKGTIEIMHMMGSTDLQAARLFQRRVALDSLFGGTIGFAAATGLLLLLGNRIQALDPGLLAGAGMPIYGWLLLLLIPLAVTGLSVAMARWTVLSTLKNML